MWQLRAQIDCHSVIHNAIRQHTRTLIINKTATIRYQIRRKYNYYSNNFNWLDDNSNEWFLVFIFFISMSLIRQRPTYIGLGWRSRKYTPQHTYIHTHTWGPIQQCRMSHLISVSFVTNNMFAKNILQVLVDGKIGWRYLSNKNVI